MPILNLLTSQQFTGSLTSEYLDLRSFKSFSYARQKAINLIRMNNKSLHSITDSCILCLAINCKTHSHISVSLTVDIHVADSVGMAQHSYSRIIHDISHEII